MNGWVFFSLLSFSLVYDVWLPWVHIWVHSTFSLLTSSFLYCHPTFSWGISHILTWRFPLWLWAAPSWFSHSTTCHSLILGGDQMRPSSPCPALVIVEFSKHSYTCTTVIFFCPTKTNQCLRKIKYVWQIVQPIHKHYFQLRLYVLCMTKCRIMLNSNQIDVRWCNDKTMNYSSQRSAFRITPELGTLC